MNRGASKDRQSTVANIIEFLEARIAEDEASNRDMAEMDDDDRGGWAILYAQRVLAECVAKRAIIADWEDPTDGGPWVADVDAGHVLATDKAVRALAAVYKDHKDYRQEWAA